MWRYGSIWLRKASTHILTDQIFPEQLAVCDMSRYSVATLALHFHSTVQYIRVQYAHALSFYSWPYAWLGYIIASYYIILCSLFCSRAKEKKSSLAKSMCEGRGGGGGVQKDEIWGNNRRRSRKKGTYYIKAAYCNAVLWTSVLCYTEQSALITALQAPRHFSFRGNFTNGRGDGGGLLILVLPKGVFTIWR